MAYTDQTQLEDRYGTRLLVELTDRAETATGQIDAATVARALNDTDAVIDGYIAARYVLPLTPVPDLIADLAQSIAIYKLHVFTPSEKIATDYRDALRALEQIARGVIRLEAQGVAPASTGGGGAQTTDRDRPMTADNLKGFI
jgi:phage gp36-like protein